MADIFFALNSLNLERSRYLKQNYLFEVFALLFKPKLETQQVGCWSYTRILRIENVPIAMYTNANIRATCIMFNFRKFKTWFPRII